MTPEDVVPSTSVDGGGLTQDEPASQTLVVYGPHLLAKKCGAYRKKLAKLRREAEGNLRPPLQDVQAPTVQSQGEPKRKKGRRIPRPRPTETTRDYEGRAVCPLRAGAPKVRPVGRNTDSRRRRPKEVLPAGSGLPPPRGRTP